MQGLDGLCLQGLVSIDHKSFELEEVIGEDELLEDLLLFGVEAPVEQLC